MDAAADFAAAEDFGFDRTFEAALAAFFPVTSVLFDCVSAEPAADFSAGVDLGLCSVFEAADAAFLPVFSIVMLWPFCCRGRFAITLALCSGIAIASLIRSVYRTLNQNACQVQFCSVYRT